MNDMVVNIRKYLMLVLLFTLSIFNGHAQNSIDKMVENYSTVGSSSFTSVVERDPDTREVKKVVKVLTVPSHQTKKFHDVFIKEKDTGSFSQQLSGGVQTLTLTCEQERQTRLYMFRKNSNNGKVTIIVKMKKLR